MASPSASVSTSAVKETPKPEAPKSEEKPERVELSDVEFIKYLVNEDISCPVCHKPFVPYDLRDIKGEHPSEDKPVPLIDEMDLKEFSEREDVKKKLAEGYVLPVLTKCNHAMCLDCATKHFEKDVVWVGSGVRCMYQKRDQLGHDPCTCFFLTPCKDPLELPVAGENMLIAKVMREITGIAFGTKNANYKENSPFFYYFKFCHHCQRQSTKICNTCHLPTCDECEKEHHSGHTLQTIGDYEKTVIQSHKCASCGKTACKYCGKCKKFLCRTRQPCFDPCMDPDHLLVEFDPNLVELKRFEYNAVDNSRKMFIHDVHDYLETNPFIWQAADMECLARTMWYQEYKRCGGGREEEKDDDSEGDD